MEKCLYSYNLGYMHTTLHPDGNNGFDINNIYIFINSKQSMMFPEYSAIRLAMLKRLSDVI